MFVSHRSLTQTLWTSWLLPVIGWHVIMWIASVQRAASGSVRLVRAGPGPVFVCVLCFCLCIYFLFVWCSEVWMSRATSGRSKQNLKGNVACSFVKFGNRTKSITANLMKLACSRNVRVVLETPPSSLMPFTRQIRSSLRICRARRHYICLGVFGAPSAKPTLLWLP
jgi:hypothetical protein